MLNNATVADFGGEYVGVVEDVRIQEVHDQKKPDAAGKPTKVRRAVLFFGDGWRLVLNKTNRKALVGGVGARVELGG